MGLAQIEQMGIGLLMERVVVIPEVMWRLAHGQRRSTDKKGTARARLSVPFVSGSYPRFRRTDVRSSGRLGLGSPLPTHWYRFWDIHVRRAIMFNFANPSSRHQEQHDRARVLTAMVDLRTNARLHNSTKVDSLEGLPSRNVRGLVADRLNPSCRPRHPDRGSQ